MKKISGICFSFLCIWTLCAIAQGQSEAKSSPALCAECIHKNLEYLASDEMRGRGSGTEDEHRAAEYIGARLKEYDIQPVNGHGYVQEIALTKRVITSAPALSFVVPGAKDPSVFVFGKDFLILDLVDATFSGPLQKMDVDSMSKLPPAKPGAVILVTGQDRKKVRSAVGSLSSSSAVAVLRQSSTEIAEEFEREGEKFPELPSMFAGQTKTVLGGRFNGLALSRTAVDALAQQPEGTVLQFRARVTENHTATWNAVGMLEGSDPTLRHAAILFSAHLDHIGVGKPIHGDSIYNGADDNASGCTAVLEIARVLGSRPRPKRTVIFALFGSEEAGGTGATYFRDHPPVPLTDLAANLEFEMIGRPDPAVKADTLWLTGWERSNLGSTLAAQGAHLVADPHPEQNFFTRSDNYVLAKQGVVAQTISSYGLHSDYHEPSDDVAHIDFKHMDSAIGSLLGPVEWLVNSDFKPGWNKDGQP